MHGTMALQLTRPLFKFAIWAVGMNVYSDTILFKLHSGHMLVTLSYFQVI